MATLTPTEKIGSMPDGSPATVGNTNPSNNPTPVTAPTATPAPSSVTTPPNNFTIPVKDIVPASPLNLPQPEIPVDHASGVVAGAKEGQNGIQSYIDELTPKETPIDKEQSSIIDRIKSLIPGTTGRGEAQLKAEEANGIPDLTKKLSELNSEIGTRTAAYEKTFSDAEVNGRGVPFSVVQGQQGAIKRAQAADIGLLHARALGLQGNITAAHAIADRSVDLMYQDRESELDAKMKQLTAIQPLLSKEEKTQSEATQQYLADKKQTLQDEKDAQKENVKYGIENNAQSNFYRRGGTVIRTSDGYAFHDMNEAVKAGVSPDLSNAPILEPIAVVKARTDAIANGTTPESKGFSTPPAGGFRTDRNNNPTAMTTDVAKSLGLIEGQDYIVGDKFPGNSNLYTAKIVGDPIETTIKGLDNAASTGKGAFRTQSGKPRWSYIDMTDAQWNAMTPEEKKATVISMYKNEGGSGTLAGGATASDNSGSVSKFVQDSDGKTYKVTTKNGKQVSKVEQKTTDSVPQADIDTGGSQLQSQTGAGKGDPKGDQYVSPEVYNNALQNWINAGYSADSFYKNYKKFVNPADPQDYHRYPV